MSNTQTTTTTTKTEPKSILKHNTSKQCECKQYSINKPEHTKQNQNKSSLPDGDLDAFKLEYDWHNDGSKSSTNRSQLNIYKSLYLMHNNELGREIVKLITYSTEMFFKKLTVELKFQNEVDFFNSPINKKIFLIRLKDFLVGRQNNPNESLNLNEKFKESYINLMQSSHVFHLSQPELPVERLLNKIDQKFISKHHNRIHADHRNHTLKDNVRRKNFKVGMCLKRFSKSNSTPANIAQQLVSNSLPDNYYENQSPYSLFNPIENLHSNVKQSQKNYIVFRTSKCAQPLIKEFKACQLSFTSQYDDPFSSASTSQTESESSDDDWADDDLPKRKPSNSEFIGLNLKEKSVALLKVNKKHKKIVRFADSLGLDLENVKNISTNSFDTFDYASSHVPFDYDLFKPKFLLSNVCELNKTKASNYHLLIVPNFTFGECTFNDIETCVEQVKLVSYTYDHSNLMIKCICRCLNLAFEKTVYAHVTLNNWSTFCNYDAHYVESMGSFDFFEFFIFLPDLKTEYTVNNKPAVNVINKCLLRIEFAICFICGCQTFWDNNNDQNYALECYLQKY